MLVENKPKDTEVMVLKLTTGDEIIATATDHKTYYTVKDPLAMIMAENPDNPTQTRVMFVPWLIAAKSTVVVDRSHVVALSLPKDDAKEQYLKAIAE